MNTNSDFYLSAQPETSKFPAIQQLGSLKQLGLTYTNNFKVCQQASNTSKESINTSLRILINFSISLTLPMHMRKSFPIIGRKNSTTSKNYLLLRLSDRTKLFRVFKIGLLKKWDKDSLFLLLLI